MRRLIPILMFMAILIGCGEPADPGLVLNGHWEELNSQLQTRKVTFSGENVYYIEGEDSFQCWAYADGALIIFPLGGDQDAAGNQRWAMKWEGSNQVILTSNGERVTLRRTSDNRELSPLGRQLVVETREQSKPPKICPWP